MAILRAELGSPKRPHPTSPFRPSHPPHEGEGESQASRSQPKGLRASMGLNLALYSILGEPWTQ